MAKNTIKVLMGLLLVIGGIMVVADAFGASTLTQYLFNFCYFALIMPACVCGIFKVNGIFDGITL